MSPQEFKEARQSLGLSVNRLAEILDVKPTTVRRWEMGSDKSTSRDPSTTACQVLRWIRSGALDLARAHQDAKQLHEEAIR